MFLIRVNHTLLVPLLASGNAGNFREMIKSVVNNYNTCGLRGKVSLSVHIKSRDMLLEYMRQNHDVLEWKNYWKKVIQSAIGDTYDSLEEWDEELKEKSIRAVFLVDGLEEIFEHTISSENEKNAIMALCK